MKITSNLVINTNSPQETRKLAISMAQLIQPGDIICLNGDLGAGKTAFSQGVAVGLGVEVPVTSPTFTLINEYQGRLPIYHFDVYRLEGSEEMYDIGYEEYFYGQGVCLIEWAQRVESVLPKERLDIFIKQENLLDFNLDTNDVRQVQFIPMGRRYHQLVEELSNLVCTRN